MYINELFQAGIINKYEYEITKLYVDNTDVIITYENNKYKISTPQESVYFDNKADFIEYVKINWHYVKQQILELYRDREIDGIEADYIDSDY